MRQPPEWKRPGLRRKHSCPDSGHARYVSWIRPQRRFRYVQAIRLTAQLFAKVFQMLLQSN